MIHDSGKAQVGSTLRLFTGIPVPPDVNARLDEFIRRLKPLARIRWSPAANFHITTKFIGAWPQARLDEMLVEMKAALGRAHGGEPLPIAIRGLGFFPNARRPRVFWTGVEGGAALADLASRTDEVCARLGVEAEKRPYAPHLTLARIDMPHDMPNGTPNGLEALNHALAELSAMEFGEFAAGAFHLYRSQPGKSGSVYTSLAEFPL